LKKRAWFKKINNVEIHNESYSDMVIADGSIVYCDPPYFNTANPGNVSRVFDHAEFWKWADVLSNRCIVIVSEFVCKSSVQDQWECIFEMDRNLRMSSLGNGDIKKVTEKVFMRGWLRCAC
jgi:site-specific DNA-adenine methylase